jgi:hypothetical protein
MTTTTTDSDHDYDDHDANHDADHGRYRMHATGNDDHNAHN